MKIPYEILITPSSKPAKNKKSSSNVVTIIVTADSEEEAQEGKQAMRVGVSTILLGRALGYSGDVLFLRELSGLAHLILTTPYLSLWPATKGPHLAYPLVRRSTPP